MQALACMPGSAVYFLRICDARYAPRLALLGSSALHRQGFLRRTTQNEVPEQLDRLEVPEPIVDW